MAETRFTPGPWKVINWNGWGIDDVHFNIGTDNDIRAVYAGPCSFQAINRKNADLIAAAPDMYEALQEIATGLHPSTGGEAWQFVEIAKNIATTALAKARGENPQQ